MTLRVTLEIIPFGDEERARTIKTVNISNVTFKEGARDNVHNYVVEVDSYKNYNDETLRISHNRSDGAETLVKKALEALGY